MSATLAGMLAPILGQAADSAITPTPAELKMISYMKDHGVNHFLMLSKHRGQILYVIGGKITDSDPVLTGKIAGNNLRKGLGVTPSGIFKLEALGDSDSIGFKPVKGTNIYYTIHPVLDVEGQHRVERLESMRPEWQRISSGCVNVARTTIGRIRGLMSMIQTFKDDKSEQQVSGGFFVVLPESKPVESIFKYPEIQVPSPSN